MTHSDSKPNLSKRIKVARGIELAVLVIRSEPIFDLLTGDLVEGDFAIVEGIIAGIINAYEG